MRGLNSEKRGNWVASKRFQQASEIARWVNEFQRRNPQEALLLIGDLNALTPADQHVDLRGILLGQQDNPVTRVKEIDLIDQDLVDLTLVVPGQYRYSYLFRGEKQQLDYLLGNQTLAAQIAEIRFSRIDYDLSDHAGLFAVLGW